MKTYAALALALTSTLTVSSVVAEPFNERGENFIATIRISLPSNRQSAIAEFGNFNERGEHYIATAPAGSSKRYPPVMAENNGFNERSNDVYVGIIPTYRVGMRLEQREKD